MIDLSMTNIMELFFQIIVSLLIGICLAVPIIFIILSIKNRKIRKIAKSQMQNLKGGNYGIQEERKRPAYRTAGAKLLRDYAEREYTKGIAGSFQDTGGKDSLVGGGTELSAIKRELADTTPAVPGKNRTKFNWD